MMAGLTAGRAPFSSALKCYREEPSKVERQTAGKPVTLGNCAARSEGGSDVRLCADGRPVTALTILSMVLCAVWLTSCGGQDGGAPVATEIPAVTEEGSGDVRIVVHWPERRGQAGTRLIPDASNSIRIRALDPALGSDLPGSNSPIVIARPPAGQNTTSDALTGLRVGSVRFVATAHSDAAGSATPAQASGHVMRAIHQGHNDDMVLTMRSTVATVEVTPPDGDIGLGSTLPLEATALDQNSSVVLVAGPWEWGSGDPSVATVDAGGLATAVGGGSAVIEATEPESSVTGNHLVHVSELSVAPLSLDFGPNVTDDSFGIKNMGHGTLNWTCTPSAAWLLVGPSVGSGVSIIDVSVDRVGLPAGPYAGTVTVGSNAGMDTVGVSMFNTAGPWATDFLEGTAAGATAGIPTDIIAGAPTFDYTMFTSFALVEPMAFGQVDGENPVANFEAALAGAGDQFVVADYCFADPAPKSGFALTAPTLTNATAPGYFELEIIAIDSNTTYGYSDTLTSMDSATNGVDIALRKYGPDGTPLESMTLKLGSFATGVTIDNNAISIFENSVNGATGLTVANAVASVDAADLVLGSGATYAVGDKIIFAIGDAGANTALVLKQDLVDGGFAAPANGLFYDGGIASVSSGWAEIRVGLAAPVGPYANSSGSTAMVGYAYYDQSAMVSVCTGDITLGRNADTLQEGTVRFSLDD